MSKKVPNKNKNILSFTRPSRKRVVYTWQKFADVLTPYQLKNLQYILQNTKNTTIADAVYLFKQKKRDHLLAQKKRREVKRLKRVIAHKKRVQIISILNRIFLIMKTYFSQPYDFHVSQKIAIMSDILSAQIKAAITTKNQSYVTEFDSFLCGISRKLAIWINEFVTLSGFYKPKPYMPYFGDKFEKIYPIDDYQLVPEQLEAKKAAEALKKEKERNEKKKSKENKKK